MTKRIDLTKELEWLHEPRGDRDVGTISKHDVVVESDYIEGLFAELKKMYAREDELLDALRIIRDDLNEGMAQGHLPIESTHGVSARKIRNFANDASQ